MLQGPGDDAVKRPRIRNYCLATIKIKYNRAKETTSLYPRKNQSRERRKESGEEREREKETPERRNARLPNANIKTNNNKTFYNHDKGKTANRIALKTQSSSSSSSSRLLLWSLRLQNPTSVQAACTDHVGHQANFLRKPLAGPIKLCIYECVCKLRTYIFIYYVWDVKETSKLSCSLYSVSIFA